VYSRRGRQARASLRSKPTCLLLQSMQCMVLLLLPPAEGLAARPAYAQPLAQWPRQYRPARRAHACCFCARSAGASGARPTPAAREAVTCQARVRTAGRHYRPSKTSSRLLCARIAGASGAGPAPVVRESWVTMHGCQPPWLRQGARGA
jgi:hypothetical protein